MYIYSANIRYNFQIQMKNLLNPSEKRGQK